jgi:hypothetical protein
VSRAIKAGLLYFALVFAIGFVLGVIRTLLLVPHLGARHAELMEAPVMIAVSFVSARWIVRRMALPYIISRRLTMGAIGLVLLLAAEFGFVLWLRGISLQQYFATRDPVAGTVYYLALVVFALAPAIVECTDAAEQ